MDCLAELRPADELLAFQELDFDRLPHIRQQVGGQEELDDAKLAAPVSVHRGFLDADYGFRSRRGRPGAGARAPAPPCG